MLLLDFIKVLGGIIIGFWLTKSHDIFKLRKDDAHKLRLAYADVEEFESEVIGLNSLDELIPLGTRNSYNILSTKNIEAFLNTRLAYFLPSELRESFRFFKNRIESHNGMVDQFKKSSFDVELINNFKESIVTDLKFLTGVYPDMTIGFIIRALLYVKTGRYAWFGFAITDNEFYSKIPPREMSMLRIFIDRKTKTPHDVQ